MTSDQRHWSLGAIWYTTLPPFGTLIFIPHQIPIESSSGMSAPNHYGRCKGRMIQVPLATHLLGAWNLKPMTERCRES